MRLACWFRCLAETIFADVQEYKYFTYTRKVRDSEDAIASTRDACATQMHLFVLRHCSFVSLPNCDASIIMAMSSLQAQIEERGERISDLVSRLTLPEKIGQLLHDNNAIPRLGVVRGTLQDHSYKDHLKAVFRARA